MHDVPLDTVTFHAEKSEVVVPSLKLEPLDFALIDGSHSFPQVFIDWFYLADALKIGSTLIVDDIYVWTGRVLCDFLDMRNRVGVQRRNSRVAVRCSRRRATPASIACGSTSLR